MAYLTDEWKSNAAHPIYQGVAFQDGLKARLEANPDLFAHYTTHDIAETLRGLNRIIPDEKNILIPLYSAYSVRNNHRFRAWDFNRRIELMKTINADPVLNSCEDQLTLLKRYNDLHGEVYGFQPERIIPINRPPIFFDKTGTRICRKRVSEYPADELIEVLSHGSHETDKILINTYYPTEDGKNVPVFHQGPVRAAALILHEGRHSFMTQLAQNLDFLEDPEAKDIATIYHLNTFGVYYLTGTDERNDLNPCEQDAYDFQGDMESFLDASPEMRKTLIMNMESRRDAHLQILRSEQTPTTNIPAFNIAA